MLVAQSCQTLCDLMDCNPPDSSVHGIFQARTLQWVAISFSRRSFWPRNQTWVSCIVGRFFTVWANRLALFFLSLSLTSLFGFIRFLHECVSVLFQNILFSKQKKSNIFLLCQVFECTEKKSLVTSLRSCPFEFEAVMCISHFYLQWSQTWCLAGGIRKKVNTHVYVAYESEVTVVWQFLNKFRLFLLQKTSPS